MISIATFPLLTKTNNAVCELNRDLD